MEVSICLSDGGTVMATWLASPPATRNLLSFSCRLTCSKILFKNAALVHWESGRNVVRLCPQMLQSCLQTRVHTASRSGNACARSLPQRQHGLLCDHWPLPCSCQGPAATCLAAPIMWALQKVQGGTAGFDLQHAAQGLWQTAPPHKPVRRLLKPCPGAGQAQLQLALQPAQTGCSDQGAQHTAQASPELCPSAVVGQNVCISWARICSTLLRAVSGTLCAVSCPATACPAD